MVDDPNAPPPSGGIEVNRARVFPGFVELDVRTKANRIERAFPLDLHLEVDEWPITINVDRQPSLMQRLLQGAPLEQSAPQTINLRVRLHHCYVRYSCEGVHIPSNTKYRSATETGSYSGKSSLTDKSASTKAHGGKIGAGAEGGPKGASASAEAAIRVSSQWEGHVTTEKVVAATHDIYEVEAVPGGWRVGDRTHGDPLKDGKLLDGPYFSRPVDDHPQTCIVEFHPGRNAGAITFDVACREGLRVRREDDGDAAHSERDRVTAAMKDRLAELCLTTEGRHQSEMILARVHVQCSVTPDEESAK